ncbi:Predicted transcriptional regulator, contains HTH domain [Halopenitus malekzadehii]|uniref:Predicted transcriptional regulator, contains HTH domain n=1 Tax=Halopenitus malekzadehii TaxID=1267564 RepID=A0A1H6HUG5_9EURY|nr:hypothetical protein [Halopenitus malekzadehii]SEH38729.1 Predicted transcriptional regulator, contains HTH domain [Halopenitus malekzadehii]
MPSEDAHEDVRYLAGSPGRIAILRAIREEPLRPAAITRRVESTRTTVQRVLAGFRERRWVVERDATYRLTATGERVCDAYENLLDATARAREFAPFAANAEPIATELPSAAFEHGSLTVASAQDPLAPVDRLIDRFEETESAAVRSVSPIVSRTFNEAAMELLGRETSIQLVIDERVLETSTESFPEAFKRALDRCDVSVRVHPDPLPVGLFTDREGPRTCLMAYDDQNTPRALFECTDESVHEWALGWFDRVQDRSRPLEDVVDDGSDPTGRDGMDADADIGDESDVA